jgi:hypothetical protein
VIISRYWGGFIRQIDIAAKYLLFILMSSSYLHIIEHINAFEKGLVGEQSVLHGHCCQINKNGRGKLSKPVDTNTKFDKKCRCFAAEISSPLATRLSAHDKIDTARSKRNP